MSTTPEQVPSTSGSAALPPPRPKIAGEPSKPSQGPVNWRQLLTALLVPLLAIFTALVIGALVILLSSANANPSQGSVTACDSLQGTHSLFVLCKSYRGLLLGAVGNPKALANTLVEATPYIFAGLAVAVGFKGGLFNIGAEGQLGIGALSAAVAGYAFTGLPMIIHLPLAILAGALGGAFWGAIPGLLRAKTGAHEVITTIMLNYISLRLTDYLIKGPFVDKTASAPRTPNIAPSAELPYLFGADYRLNAGFILAIIMVVVIWWLLRKTTVGFEIRTVGANLDAARYAGMSVTRNFVLTMALSGALAGLAGAVTVLGLEHNLKSAFSAGYGFDSIAVALLAKSNPLAIIPAAIFWGALRNGAGLMQLESGISINLINIVQALVIIFVAADQIVRWIYRIRGNSGAQAIFTRGWGG